MPFYVAGLGYAWIAGAVVAGLLMTLMRGMLPAAEWRRYMIFWAVLVAGFFFSRNPLMFSGFSVLFLLVVRRSFDPLPAAAFFLMLLPPGYFYFGQLGPINYLLKVNFAFLVCAILMAPAAIRALTGRGLKGLGIVDVAVWVFFLATVIFFLRATTFTNALRNGFVSLVTVVFVYYAFSRIPRDRETLEKIARAFVLAGLVVAMIGTVASFQFWDFFQSQNGRLFVDFSLTKTRAGALRVSSTFGGAYIDFGITCTVVLLVASVFIARIKGVLGRLAAMGVLLFGAYATGSRGPFFGLLVTAPVFLMFRPDTVKLGMRLGVIGVITLAAVLTTPKGQEVLSFIPFVGNPDLSEGSVTYRQDLWRNSWEVIKRWPLFGNPYFLQTPWMQAMRQGEGIIDILNVYLDQAMRHGVPVAILYFLAHFVPPFASFLQLRAYREEEDLEWRLLGTGIAGGMLIYAISYMTTAKLGFAPEIGWMLIGLNVAHYRISRAELQERAAATVRARREKRAQMATGLGGTPTSYGAAR